MNADFFKNLYKGYAAEHFVSSLLYERGLEVFRLPADFGFDLIITNQFHNFLGELSDTSRFPFALQVKSRWLSSGNFREGANGRKVVSIQYGLKESEVELVIKTPNSAFVLVYYWPVDSEGKYEARMFLLYAEDIAELQKRGFFVKDLTNPGKVKFTIDYHTIPEMKREEYVDGLIQAKFLVESSRESLLKVLPNTLSKGWNADNYVKMHRKDYRDPKYTQLVIRRVFDVQTDFNKFPNHSPINIEQ